MRDKIQTMKLLKNKLGICRLNCEDIIPEWVNKSDFYSVTKTMDELSIVVSQNCISGGVKCERNWRMFKVLGPLDFSLIGILSYNSYL